MLCEEQSEEFQNEIDSLRLEVSSMSREMNSKEANVEQLSNELNQVRRICQEREREVSTNICVIILFMCMYVLVYVHISACWYLLVWGFVCVHVCIYHEN